MMAVQHVDMTGLIDYLSQLLGSRFSRDVAQIYYGDIMVYLPSSFGGSRKEQKAIIALSPAYDHVIPESRVASQESHLLGLDILVMVNITPFFKANPTEAYGERMLVNLTTAITRFLVQAENENFGGRVQFAQVNGIDWSWLARDDQAIRAAGIQYECRVRLPRM